MYTFFIQYLDLEEEFEKWKAQMEEEISQKDKEIKNLHEKIKSLERPIMTDMSVQVTDELIFPSLFTRSNYVPNDSFNIQPSNDSVLKLAQCIDNIHNLPEEYKFNKILESSTSSNDFTPRLSKDDLDDDNCNLHQIYPHYHHNAEYYFLQNTSKLQNLKAPNCQCMRNDAQVACININILQNLSMKLQAQERKKNQLQECLKKQQYHTERVLQRKSFTILFK